MDLAALFYNPGDLFITSYQLNQLTFPEVPIVDVLLELHPLEGEGRGGLVLQPVPPSGGQRRLNTGGGEGGRYCHDNYLGKDTVFELACAIL